MAIQAKLLLIAFHRPKSHHGPPWVLRSDVLFAGGGAPGFQWTPAGGFTTLPAGVTAIAHRYDGAAWTGQMDQSPTVCVQMLEITGPLALLRTLDQKNTILWGRTQGDASLYLPSRQIAALFLPMESQATGIKRWVWPGWAAVSPAPAVLRIEAASAPRDDYAHFLINAVTSIGQPVSSPFWKYYTNEVEIGSFSTYEPPTEVTMSPSDPFFLPSLEGRLFDNTTTTPVVAAPPAAPPVVVPSSDAPTRADLAALEAKIDSVSNSLASIGSALRLVATATELRNHMAARQAEARTLSENDAVVVTQIDQLASRIPSSQRRMGELALVAAASLL